jgi:hypothetical protein
MKNKLQILTIALVSLIFTNGYSATRTWTGGSDGSWTKRQNWNGGASAPSSGDSIVIPNTGVTNNPSSNVSGTYLSLTITRQNFTLSLNGNLTITNKVTLNATGAALNLNGRTLTTTAPVLTNGSILSTNTASILSITGTYSGNLHSINKGRIQYVNLTITSAKNLPDTTTVTGTLTLNGGNLDINGKTLTTTTPVLTSGSIISTKNASILVISGTHTSSLLTNLTRGLITYTNLTVSTNQTLTDTIAITGNLTLNGNTFNTAGFLSTIGGNVTVTSASTLQSTGVSRIDATNQTLDINGGGLLLNNVELVVDDLDFTTANFITASNGGFLSFDNSSGHDINGNSPGVALNTAHVNAKVRLYTKSTNGSTFNFPIGDGTVYSPFIFDPTNVTGSTTFGQWVEVTYTGAKASQLSLDGATLKGASGHEYWTVVSSASTVIGTVALRYDANSTKTGKTVISGGSASNLILAQYDSATSKWKGIAAGTGASSNITTSTTSSSVNPKSLWTLGSNTTGLSFFVALPVTLINFDAVANKSNKTVEVRWATATEENNSHFEIMHSTDFVNWTSIGTVYSQGNGNEMNVYSFTDINPSTVNQYKLKIVALNGEVSYTSIKLVKFTETISTTVSVYPNPANANVNLSVDNMDMSTPVTIQLMNPMGQVVFEQIITENYSGMMNTSIPTSEFAAGIYQVSITSATGTVSQKLIINH